ncbi:superfamily II DNA/RNA helicase [Enterococcus sp. PF1-24]|uniref:DEAD/DEAH box helicase n=1 Tax=unclassified Enterococcus TaxID=2608891 RepID=UPI002473225E|nr:MULTISPECIES: DEAD/DEAH box helicase [unclassified Enterococcus]MDH6364459.1 superfamily II DNA/RNA helicase [Enterococcus sp. PFB1-1]MDH6401518.1 superfamily II DNA/RNA helicase [Enterococcus sp. PF1-24]
MTDKEMQMPEKWQVRWQEQGFTTFSPIQKQSYQPLKSGEDVLGISPTGSGKTLAYTLPLLEKVVKGAGMQLLILTSSQELGMQVFEVVKTWGADLGLITQSVIGGANVKRQIEKLKTKPEILVGTSGRVVELIKQKKIKSHQIKTVVFDEADQLFADPLTKQVVKAVSRETQLAFFSATGQQVLAEAQNLRPAISVIDVTAEDTSHAGIQHYYIVVPPRKRVDELRRLANIPAFQGLVFFNEISELGNAEEKLVYHQLPVSSLASDQNKLLRKGAINKFKAGELSLLLATDIAARGLDIDDLPYVVNVDVPLTEESYLHRSGRTGRMGKAGQVITFIHDGSRRDYQRLMKKVAIKATQIYLYDGALQQTAKPETTASEKNRDKTSSKKPAAKKTKSNSGKKNTTKKVRKKQK